MKHLLWVLSYRCSQGKGQLHLPTLLAFAVLQVTWFSYRGMTSIVEICWSSRSPPFCRLHADVWFYLSQRHWDCWVSVIQTLAVPAGEHLDVAVLWPPGRGGHLGRSATHEGLCWPSFRELCLWRVCSCWCGWRVCKWETRKTFALCFLIFVWLQTCFFSL